MVTVIRQLDPLNPLARKIGTVEEGATLQAVFDEYGNIIPEYQDLVLFLNGRPVLRAAWNYTLAANDHVYIKPFPRGGGDGNKMRGVAQLAVAAAAMYVGGPAGAAIMIGGNLAINAFMPLPTPPTPQQVQPFSNTYQSQARGNVAKPMQPMPFQCGELEFYPDEAARSYFAYEDNKQIYYQLLCLGVNEFDANTDTIKLGGNDFDLFENREFQVVLPGQTLTLVNPSVTPVAVNQVEIEDSSLLDGGRLVGADDSNGKSMSMSYHSGTGATFAAGEGGFVGRHPVENYNWIELDVGTKIRFVNTSSQYSAIVPVSYVTRDSQQRVTSFRVAPAQYANIQAFINACYDEYGDDSGGTWPYYACHVIVWDEVENAPALQFTDTFTIDSNDNITSLQTDTVVPKGGQGEVLMRIQVREIDEDNNPITGWDSNTIALSRSTTEDLYRSTTVALVAGRYQVRFSRVDYKSDFQDVVYLTGLKGIGSTAPNTTISEGCTLLALRVEVPESQNITLGETRVVATAKTPTLAFNGTNYYWTAAAANRTITGAIAAVMQQKYGANFSDYLMPLDELYALHQVWEARGDQFNGRFDQQITDKEAIQLVARAGRAVALEIGDKWYFVRDQPGVPTYPYSPANIISDENTAEPFYTVRHTRPLPSDPDGIIVEFFNAKYWEWDETPSYPTDATNPKRVRMFGVTNKNQAWRECCYLYATDIIKPAIITWRTELEALNHGYGDLISMAPPKSNVYGAGYVESFSGNVIELSEPMPWESGYHYLTLRRDDGTRSGPYEVSRGSSDYHCVLKAGQTLDFTPHNGLFNGSQREATHAQFGKIATGITVRLLSRKQVGDHEFELTGSIETDFKHTIDATPYPV